MENVKEIIYAYKPNNAKITNDTYITRIKKIIGGGVNPANFSEVKNYLENSKLKFKTKRSYYTSILVYLKAKGLSCAECEKTIKSMGKEIEAQDDKNVVDKELVTRKEIEEILKKQWELINKDINIKGYFLLQEHLLLNLYFLVPPVRNDYVDTLVVDVLPKKMETGFNYISFKDRKLYLYRYKTSKKYGLIMIELPEKIIELIHLLFFYRDKIFGNSLDTNILFLNREHKPATKANLIQCLYKIFGRNVSVTILRKSYVSEKYPVISSLEERKKDANIMGHSVALQQSTYSKIL